MTIMPAATIVFLFKSWFSFAAVGIMMFFCIGAFYSQCRIVIESTELFSTLPTPGATASCSFDKLTSGLQSTGKDVIACIIFQAPTITPRALFGVHIIDNFWMNSLDLLSQINWWLIRSVGTSRTARSARSARTANTARTGRSRWAWTRSMTRFICTTRTLYTVHIYVYISMNCYVQFD